MKVLVCGAGQVGSSIARHLAAENNDVTVIDQAPELVRKLSDSFEVNGIVGHASHPDVLEKAGAADADMIVAVTYADEVNMIACQIAHSLFKVPTKIARVREQKYLDPIWSDLFSRDHMPIDVIISPEIEVAKAIARRLQIPGAFDSIPLANGRIKVVGVRISEECPLIHTPLLQLSGLFPDLDIMVVGIIRKDQLIIPDPTEQMLPGDEIYFVADSGHVARAMLAFGQEESEARRVIVVGGGNIGLYLGKVISQEYPGINLKIIEIDKQQAELAARELDEAVILNGDALDPDMLGEANIRQTEAIISVTNDDEINILSSLLAKRYGAQRAITLVNKITYGPLITDLGIDVVVSPRATTVSTILQHVRRGRIRSVHTLGENVGEIVELEALETSPLVGIPLKDIELPMGVLIGALMRDDEVIIPTGTTVMNPNDRVVLFAAAGAVKKVEKMFSVRLEYF